MVLETKFSKETMYLCNHKSRMYSFWPWNWGGNSNGNK